MTFGESERMEMLAIGSLRLATLNRSYYVLFILCQKDRQLWLCICVTCQEPV